MIENTCIKSSCGAKIHCIYSLPGCEIKGLVQIVHGMSEYAARYKPFIEFLNDNGYMVFGHDHFGHGQTAMSTAELGYIPMKGGADMLVDDTIAVAKHFAQDYSDKPFYLMGHSMGSFISRCVLAKAGDMYTAAAFSGTGYAVPGAAVGKSIAMRIAESKGEKAYSDFIYGLAFDKYNKKTARRTSYDWICRDSSVVDEYIADVYCGFPFTVSALAVLMELNIRCNSDKVFSSTPKGLPILLLAGTSDPVGNYGHGVKQVYDSYRKNNLDNVAIKLYKDARHEILNELNKVEVMRDMLTWYEKHR